MRAQAVLFTLVTLLTLLCAPARCSSGDRHVLYQRCFTNCKGTGCAQYDVRQPLYCDTICHSKGSIMLRPLLWTCEVRRLTVRFLREPWHVRLPPRAHHKRAKQARCCSVCALLDERPGAAYGSSFEVDPEAGCTHRVRWLRSQCL